MGTKEKVLRVLKASPAQLSGEKIAQQLSISRTSVWKAIKELEKQGYRFAHESNGYRYLPSDILDPEEIEHGLQEVLPDLAVLLINDSESTMKDAKRAALDGLDRPALFLADHQTAAHGRFHRPFFAESGQGIYMSLLLHPHALFTDLPSYTVIAASACAQAIDQISKKTTTIKWINDIFLDGKKVCGILSEAISDIETGQISQVIIGVGINFAIPQDEFPEALRPIATSIFPDEEPIVTRNQLIIAIGKAFFHFLSTLSTKEYLTMYRQKSMVLGQSVRFKKQGTSYQGIAQKITDHGELVVAVDGKEILLSSGEISLEK